MTSWGEQYCPVLYIRQDEAQYWRTHRDHRPTWFYRPIIDSRRKRVCTQFIAHWPDQFDWFLSRHRWDYEPVFLYFEYRGSGPSPRTAMLTYMYYTHGHWLARKLHPPFVMEDTRPVLVLQSKHHAYEPLRPLDTGAGGADNRRLTRYSPRHPPQRMTDEVISSWRGRPENPFSMWNDFVDPWHDGDGPGPEFD